MAVVVLFETLADMLVARTAHGAVVPRTVGGAGVCADLLEQGGLDDHAEVLRSLDTHKRRTLSRMYVHFLAYRRGWWRSLTGEWMRTEEMDDGYLLNSARMLLFGQARGRQHSAEEGRKWMARHPVLAQEVVRRGLLLFVTPKAHYKVRDFLEDRQRV